MPPNESRETGRVALYARTWLGDPDNSLEVQVEALHEYFRRPRLEAVRVYFETQSTQGRGPVPRNDGGCHRGGVPPFRQMLVRDMGQLSRWAGGVSTLQDRLEANGATVVPVTVGPEPRPP